MNILITGGKGNIGSIVNNRLRDYYNITNYTNDLTNLDNLKKYLSTNSFDILIHCAIKGGRRTKEDTPEIFYNNILIFENILNVSNNFKMIINLDSGAIYDRKTNIFNRKENEECIKPPNDYYGFSKYIIYKRSIEYKNIFHLRLFNIFHVNEEPDRFIKKCFISKKNKIPLEIINDKYFDFVSECDFIKIVEYYIHTDMSNLPKVVNVCYEIKYKLSDIAKLIIKNENLIKINNTDNLNYCGDSSILKKLNIKFNGLEDSLNNYSLSYLN
jgi:nucleoside-diphosphate-sugar epimerase